MAGNFEIKVGIFGAGRGASFAANAVVNGMKVVAVCDKWEAHARNLADQYNAAVYTDFDDFLTHDMDAVVVTNYFHQHAPFAIRALQAGKHVISECLACKTCAEGVALVEAVEASGQIYFFAENYAYFTYVQEMRRLYQAGEIGELCYGEGEYNHPMAADDLNRISPGVNHWRNTLPPTYYTTHALSPVMYATDTRPVNVNAQSIPDFRDNVRAKTVRRNDAGFVTILRMDNGAIVRLFGLGLAGHSIWYRLHGTHGLMENLRTGDQGQLRVVHEPWDIEGDQQPEKIYSPSIPLGEEAAKSGHGGGDFFTMHYFAEAIRTGQQPWMNVYRAMDMSLVGIQAWRSCLANGAPFEIPDFRDASVREKYREDDWSPFPEDRRPGQPWPSIKGEIQPTPEGLAHARKIWRELGYEGD